MSKNPLATVLKISALGLTLSVSLTVASHAQLIPQSPALSKLPALQRYLQNASERWSSMSEQDKWMDFSYLDHKGVRRSLVAAADQNMWAHKDLEADKIPGTSTEKAYRDLKLTQPEKPITVAVIDSGVDIRHEDLAEQIWTNEKEMKGFPGLDDDGNGFVDDFHGWNFAGSKNGMDLVHTNFEVTRELARMKKKQAANDGLNDVDAAYLAQLQKGYDAQKTRYGTIIQRYVTRLNELSTALEVLKGAGLKEETIQAITALQSDDQTVKNARDVALNFLNSGITTGALKEQIASLEKSTSYYFNLEFNASRLIGDTDQLDEVGYGNNHVTTETADHGTHVSGIIGAVRGNGKGMDGQAQFVKIMGLRAVPDGDERDKDVANAIFYAVRQGARIINMSFGKAFSPNKAYVDWALKYAEEKSVLVVQAAGNDAVDNDIKDHFPNRRGPSENLKHLAFNNYMVVGASTVSPAEKLPATFSNYGKFTVDLFAPGHQIFATMPGNDYAALSGTSMASPEVAGVAALVLSQYPSLSAAELRNILMESSVRLPGLNVNRPGGGSAEFSSLSITGGLVNAYKALQLAGEKAK